MTKSSKKAAILAAILWSFLDPAQSVHTCKKRICQKALAWMECHILTPHLGHKV